MNRVKYYLSLAKAVAQKSKDPSTKTGAVIVDQQGRIVSTGYNGFPRSMPDKPEWYQNRDEKYSRIVHCEMNALIFAKHSCEGCTLFTWPFLSCDRCAVHMLQAGILNFIAPVCPPEQATRWEEAFKKTRHYVNVCGGTVAECLDWEALP